MPILQQVYNADGNARLCSPDGVVIMIRFRASLAVAAAMASMPGIATADPCGMVPPITVQDDASLVRVGDQQTYVFFKGGLETFVIRPGFSGNVEDFGMLIPFPTPPAIRKVPESIFGHVAAAIDPPEVEVDVRFDPRSRGRSLSTFGRPAREPAKPGLDLLKQDEVRVLREEAVGMYEVAVLEAGSSAALKKWMTEHKYKFPEGMDAVCDDYVDLRWCFVAVKTKVGGKSNVDPKPGQRDVNTKLPSGSTFDGHVQAMGFRFKSDKLVVPMRLSAFNEGELRNIVYLLTDGPRRIRSIPEEYVVRQVLGEELFRNVTAPLPLRIIGGTEADIPDWQRQSLPQRRDPAPHNGNAKEMFASDMLALSKNRLSHPHEESEKMLLRIGEHFGLRGPSIDTENLAVLADERKRATDAAVADLKRMTLTMIDGDFPREVLGGQNLAFSEYKMPARRNSRAYYDAKTKRPGDKQEGVLKLGALDSSSRKSGRGPLRLGAITFGAVGFLLALAMLGLTVGRRRGR